MSADGCAPSCGDHSEHVYILCYGRPTIVGDRDHLRLDPTLGYPITHYVGYTRQQPPVKRVRGHGARSAHFIAAIRPGTMLDEEALKVRGSCPRCGGSLWYFAESPTYRPEFAHWGERRSPDTCPLGEPKRPDPASATGTGRMQRRREPGWQKPAGAIIIDRTTRWGNPFTVDAVRNAGCAGDLDHARSHCAHRFRLWLLGEAPGDPDLIKAGKRTFDRRWMGAHLPELQGHVLCCACPIESPCHGDVLAELANGSP